jgi:hypothetical protein
MRVLLPLSAVWNEMFVTNFNSNFFQNRDCPTTKRTMKITDLPVQSIRTDGGTQVRVTENSSAIERYADAMSRGVTLPAIDVFYDGNDYWLADGHHRLAAHKKCRHDTVSCQVHEGDRTGALLFACQSNQEHGLPLTNADKRNIVIAYFSIPGNETKSNNAASKILGVSVPFIKNVREEAGVKPSPAAHVGVGAKKNLNGLNNSTVLEDGTYLNRLNNPLNNVPAKPTEEYIDVSLSARNQQEFAVVLFEHFDAKYLKSCVKLLDDLLKA